jgi:hypothetical protein
MTTTFPFHFQDMMHWYIKHWKNTKYFESARDTVAYTHIHTSKKYEKMPKRDLKRLRREADRTAAPASHHRHHQRLGLFIKDHIRRIARFKPQAATLPFLTTPPPPASRAKYPLGLYAVIDETYNSIFMVYPVEKTNQVGQKATFADHMSFMPNRERPAVIDLHRTTYIVTGADITSGMADHSFRNPFPDGTPLPREGYATAVFAKLLGYENDVLDMARFHARAEGAESSSSGNSNSSAATMEGGGRRQHVVRRLSSKRRSPPPRLRLSARSPSAAERVRGAVSARLERVLLRHRIRDLRLIGVATAAGTGAGAGAWHYTCFLELDAPNPMLEYDLAFQARDGSWRAAQHALLRRFRALEESYVPVPEGSLSD